MLKRSVPVPFIEGGSVAPATTWIRTPNLAALVAGYRHQLRYDGHAAWYDETFSAFDGEEEAGFLGAIADAGLDLRKIDEFSGGGVVLPRNLGIVAGKT
jgi:hypothetical protein